MIPISLEFGCGQSVKVTDPHSKFYGLVGAVKYATVYAAYDDPPLIEYTVGDFDTYDLGLHNQEGTFTASALEGVIGEYEKWYEQRKAYSS